MAAKTYKARALVLKKTKLREKDLIVSMLDESGMLMQGVAKGARKPGGSFAARLELFSEVDVLMAQGRSLDVVCEARLADASQVRVWELEQSACAAALAELLCHISQPDLQQPRVFDISKAAFSIMGAGSLDFRHTAALCAASLWKVMAQAGFKPSFSTCVSCGAAVDARPSQGDRGRLALSIADGGVVCDACFRPADAIMVPANTLAWCDALIMMRFAEVSDAQIDDDTLMDVLQIARLWCRAHVGRDLKSLDFLFQLAR